MPDEQHPMPPPNSVPTSSTASHAFAVPFISPLSRFADLLLRSPAINSLVSNFPPAQYPPRETSSRPEGDSPGPSELQTFLSVTFCCGEMKSFEGNGASQQCFDPEPALMEMGDETTPASPVGVDPLDEPPPQ